MEGAETAESARRGQPRGEKHSERLHKVDRRPRGLGLRPLEALGLHMIRSAEPALACAV